MERVKQKQMTVYYKRKQKDSLEVELLKLNLIFKINAT